MNDAQKILMAFEDEIRDVASSILANMSEGRCDDYPEYVKLSSRYKALMDSVEILKTAIRNADKHLED